MSIESDVKKMAEAQERTANALEMILTLIKTGLAVESVKDIRPDKIDAPGINAPKKSVVESPVVGGGNGKPAGISGLTPPGISAAAPVTTPAVATPGTTGAAITQVWPTNQDELRLMAQKIAQKMGPKTLEFTKWVNQLLVPYGVQTIVALPSQHVVEVAKKLDEYAKAAGVNV